MMRRLPVLLLLALFGATGCERDSTTPVAGGDTSELPADQIVYGLRHIMTTEGVRKAYLVGDTAYLNEQGARIDLVGVKLDFFDANGRENGHLTSRTGEYNVRSGEFVARGDAVLITQGAKGERRLETDELHFDSKADQIWSDQPFVVRENGQTSRGDSFRSDTRFENLTVERARGTLPTSGSEGIRF